MTIRAYAHYLQLQVSLKIRWIGIWIDDHMDDALTGFQIVSVIAMALAIVAFMMLIIAHRGGF